MSENGLRRRSLISGVAWAVPAATVVSGAPALAASHPPTVPPGVTINASRCRWNSEWNHYVDPDGNCRGSGTPSQSDEQDCSEYHSNNCEDYSGLIKGCSGDSVSAPKCSLSGDQKQYNGWIADGISITLGDESGQPLAGVSVTFKVKADEKQFWLVEDPTMSSSDAWKDGSPRRVKELTLTTDENGVIRLDGGVGSAYSCDEKLIGYNAACDGGQWGYLRKGEDDSTHGTLTVSADGYDSKTQRIWNYSPTSNPCEQLLFWPGLRVAGGC
ncbi:hypothetical protein GCM10023159_10990 [Brevibacterium yomogidense]